MYRYIIYFLDEPCTFDNGEIGICKQITDCDTAMNQLRESGQAPKTCSFEKEMPIVCCQKPNVIEKINSGRICQQSKYALHFNTFKKRHIFLVT